MFKLFPAKDDAVLFYLMQGESAGRHGALGYLRADFGKSGREFWTTWFDIQPDLKTPAFREEFDDIINSLRNDGGNPPFSSRAALESFCRANPGKDLSGRGNGYIIRTQGYSYYFRCLPRPGDYDIYCFVYDNCFLLPELKKKAEETELMNKSEFVAKCGEVLKMAKPYLVSCKYMLGKDLPPGDSVKYMDEDEYVLITCENGYSYKLNVTCNSLCAVAEEILGRMKYR